MFEALAVQAYEQMLLIVEYFILFGPALLIAGVGLAMFPLGLLMGGHGMMAGAVPIMLIELFSLLGLYGCFQLLRKSLHPEVEIARPMVLLVFLLLGMLAIIAFGLMGAFYEFGWHLYLLLAPALGAIHLIYLNREFLFSGHS